MPRGKVRHTTDLDPAVYEAAREIADHDGLALTDVTRAMYELLVEDPKARERFLKLARDQQEARNLAHAAASGTRANPSRPPARRAG